MHGKIGDALSDTGSLVTGTFSEVVDDIESGLDEGLSNKYISTTLKVLLALYAAFAAPKLPKEMALMLDHTVVRIIIAALIVFVATKDSSMAILLALAFILSLQTANKYKLIDTSESVSKKGQLSWLPSAKGNHPHHHSESTHEHYANYSGAEEGHDTHSHNFAPVGGDDSQLLPHQGNQPTHHPTHHPNPTHHESPLVDLSPDEEHHSSHPHPTHLVAQGHSDTHHSHAVPTDSHELEHVPAEIHHDHHTQVDSSHAQTHAPAGDNCIPGANQKTCVQTYRNEFCPQGLNQPSGYDNGLEYSRV